jgi:iron complex outermembrane recepter protein
MKRSAIALCLLGMSALRCAAGWAQALDNTPSQTELPAVTVTALRHQEDNQDVPIAITVFSRDTISSKGLTDLHDLSNLVPNVNLDQGSIFSGSNSVLAASIRGIGQDDFAFNLDPGVGVYLDGVYLARTVGANQDLLDVDHVEILKGPQGTLFGRNTIGGAISIVTRSPGDQFYMQGSASIGSYDRRDVSLTADIPLARYLLSSVSVSSEYQDGYQKRIPYPSDVPHVTDPIGQFRLAGTETFSTLGGTNRQAIRAKVLWNALDDLTATFTGDWTHANQPSTATTVLQTVTTGPHALFGAFYNDCIEGIMFAPDAPLICGPRAGLGTGLWRANLNPDTTRLAYGPAVAQTGDIDSSYATGPDFDNLNSYGVSATVDWSINPRLKVRSISAWRRLTWASATDADGSPVDQFQLSFAEGQHQISEELQLIGSLLDSRLQLVAGLYYFSEGGYINDFVFLGAGLLQIYGPNTLDTSADATYLHADYRLTDRIGLTLGGRYSADHKSFTGGQQELNQIFYKLSGCYPYYASASLIDGPPNLTCQQALGFPNPSNPNQIYPVGENHLSFNEFTPTGGLQYHFSDAIMGYFSYAQGFKSGGWTTRLSAPIPLGSPAPSFGPETDKTYEVGLKSEFLERRLIMDSALFLSNYDQIQLTYSQLLSPVTQNAGNAQIKGGEIESQSLLADHVSVNASLGYMIARYTEVNEYARATTGTYLPKTPRLKLILGPVVHTQIQSGATLRVTLDYVHTSEIYNDVQNTWLLRRPPEDILNASAAIIAPQDKLSLTVGVANMTDRRYITTGQQNDAAGVIYGTYNAPREWFASLGLRY